MYSKIDIDMVSFFFVLILKTHYRFLNALLIHILELYQYYVVLVPRVPDYTATSPFQVTKLGP